MSKNSLYPGLNLGETHGEADVQAETTVFGFWVFLMSDLIIFGILFATYASYLDPIGLAGGPGPADLFDINSVAIQTAFLLVGGVAYAGVSLAAKYGHGRGRLVVWLLVCAALGAGFLFFEVRDFISQAGQGRHAAGERLAQFLLGAGRTARHPRLLRHPLDLRHDRADRHARH